MKRILLVRTDRVGDVVFITPMIRELRKAFPDSFIATLTQPHTKNLLINNPYLDEALTDDFSEESFISIVKTLKSFKFTHGLLMMPTQRAAFQMFLAGIPERIGVGHKLYEAVTFMKSVTRNKYTPLRHEADYCMDLARKIGVKTNNILLEIFLSDKERMEAVCLLNKFGVRDDDIKILIHSGSLGSAPNWSEKNYFDLLKKIISEFNNENIKILLTAREMSDKFLKDIHDLNCNKIINIVSALDNLRDFIKIIGQADVFLGPSTGPLHIADALGIKTIGIHCHRAMSCAVHQGILNNKSINIEVTDENCKKLCSADQNTCGIENGISIDEVFSAIRRLISNK